MQIFETKVLLVTTLRNSVTAFMSKVYIVISVSSTRHPLNRKLRNLRETRGVTEFRLFFIIRKFKKNTNINEIQEIKTHSKYDKEKTSEQKQIKIKGRKS